MINALLIDLDDVLRIWDRSRARQLEEEAGLELGTLHTIAFTPELLLPAITGQVTDEEWRSRIAQGLQQRYPACDAAQIVRMWTDQQAAVDAEVLAIVRACQQRVPVVLITNATSRLPDDLRRLGLEDAFDHIINSSAVGACKPDAAIFRAALAAVGVGPEQVIFIDDTPGHVEAARRVGLHAHIYQDSAQLRELLERHGLLEPRLPDEGRSSF